MSENLCYLIYLMKSESESEVSQSCQTLCNPVDCSPPGFSIHGILQARMLEWVASSFSRGSSRPRDRTQVSRIAGRCFYLWASREYPNLPDTILLLYNYSPSVISESLWPHEIYSPWNSPGQNTGVGSCSLLQGTSPTQALNPGLPRYRHILH